MIDLASLEHDLPRILTPVEKGETLDGLTHSAAVMILFVYQDDQWHILYTRRTNEVSTHQGEVSFPGGSYEPGDRGLVETALREVEEEIGVPQEAIAVCGQLSIHETISGFLVYPFVGILKSDIKFNVNANEVERVFTIPLEWLMDDRNLYEEDHLVYGKLVRNVLHYRDYDDEHLWGLSARITQDLIGRIKSKT